MTRSLGSGSSIPREGTAQTPMKEAARGGEAEPNDRGPTNPSDYAYEDQTPDRDRDARSPGGRDAPVPDPHLLDSGFGPSNVQLALAQAHVLWAKRHAPHLLEEWLR